MQHEILIPELRFPEYSKENGNNSINKFRFDDLFNFSTGKNIKQKEASPEFETPCVRYGELYHMYGEVIYKVINRTNLNKDELVFSEGNEILLPSAGEDPLDIGSASALTVKDVAIGRTINVLKPKLDSKYSQIFVSYYINQKLKRKISSLAKGVSISNVYNSDLKKLEIKLPSLKEQQKIASFLTAIDKRIKGLEEKKIQLEQYKKGLMQQLFNQDIRFKDDDGNAFPDWEEMRLGEIADITTGKLDANAMVANGKYRFYTCAKEYYQIDNYDYDFEALLISGNGANVGYVHYYNGKFNAYQRTYILHNLSESFLFIKYFLDKNLQRRIHREKKDGNTPYIVMNTLTDMKIVLPILQEQKKIADFLSGIDKSIDAFSIQIDRTKDFKKGLLQKMFV